MFNFEDPACTESVKAAVDSTSMLFIITGNVYEATVLMRLTLPSTLGCQSVDPYPQAHTVLSGNTCYLAAGERKEVLVPMGRYH